MFTLRLWLFQYGGRLRRNSSGLWVNCINVWTTNVFLLIYFYYNIHLSSSKWRSRLLSTDHDSSLAKETKLCLRVAPDKRSRWMPTMQIKMFWCVCAKPPAYFRRCSFQRSSFTTARKNVSANWTGWKVVNELGNKVIWHQLSRSHTEFIQNWKPGSVADTQK